MGWEGVGVILTAVTMVCSLVGGAFGIAFFFGKIISRLDNLCETFNTFCTEFKMHILKEDDTHKAMWTKIDDHSGKLIEHHQRISSIEKNEH